METTDKQLKQEQDNKNSIAWYVSSHMKGDIAELEITDGPMGLQIVDTDKKVYTIMVFEQESIEE